MWNLTSSCTLSAGTTSHGITAPSMTRCAKDSGTCGTGMAMGLAPSALSASAACRVGERSLSPFRSSIVLTCLLACTRPWSCDHRQIGVDFAELLLELRLIELLCRLGVHDAAAGGDEGQLDHFHAGEAAGGRAEGPDEIGDAVADLIEELGRGAAELHRGEDVDLDPSLRVRLDLAGPGRQELGVPVRDRRQEMVHLEGDLRRLRVALAQERGGGDGTPPARARKRRRLAFIGYSSCPGLNPGYGLIGAQGGNRGPARACQASVSDRRFEGKCVEPLRSRAREEVDASVVERLSPPAPHPRDATSNLMLVQVVGRIRVEPGIMEPAGTASIGPELSGIGANTDGSVSGGGMLAVEAGSAIGCGVLATCAGAPFASATWTSRFGRAGVTMISRAAKARASGPAHLSERRGSALGERPEGRVLAAIRIGGSHGGGAVGDQGGDARLLLGPSRGRESLLRRVLERPERASVRQPDGRFFARGLEAIGAILQLSPESDVLIGTILRHVLRGHAERIGLNWKACCPPAKASRASA